MREHSGVAGLGVTTLGTGTVDVNVVVFAGLGIRRTHVRRPTCAGTRTKTAAVFRRATRHGSR